MRKYQRFVVHSATVAGCYHSEGMWQTKTIEKNLHYLWGGKKRFREEFPIQKSWNDFTVAMFSLLENGMNTKKNEYISRKGISMLLNFFWKPNESLKTALLQVKYRQFKKKLTATEDEKIKIKVKLTSESEPFLFPSSTTIFVSESFSILLMGSVQLQAYGFDWIAPNS